MENTESLKENIWSTLTAHFEGTTLFVVDVQVSVTGKITVYADGESNITIQQCAEISRFLENYLETEGLVGEKYLLEVSSPGLDEPFKVPQQYSKWLNREVEVLLRSGVKETGTLTAFDEQGVTIVVPEQKKKKEVIPAETKTFSNDDIKYTRKHFVFK